MPPEAGTATLSVSAPSRKYETALPGVRFVIWSAAVGWGEVVNQRQVHQAPLFQVRRLTEPPRPASPAQVAGLKRAAGEETGRVMSARAGRVNTRSAAKARKRAMPVGAMP